MLRLSYLAAIVGIAGGCGLIDSSVTDFKLRFPRHDFQIDVADWRLMGTGTVPNVACSAGCESATATFCGGGTCRTDCNSSAQTCQAHVTVSLRNDFDLATQAPEYQKIADQPFLSVTIDDVYFDVTENTLTVATPALSVYFGPIGATSPSDSGVALVGTIDALAPGTTGHREVRFEGSGKQVMKQFMDDFHTPFRVLVVGEVTIHGGDALPMGRLVGSVQAEAHVGLD